MLYRILAIVLILAATVYYSLYQRDSLQSQIVSDTASTSVLTQLPDTQFETLEQKPFGLYDFFQKESPELVIVHYWGTWCGPCEAELPDLIKFIKRFEKQSGVKFLLVAVDDELVKVKKHVAGLPPLGANVHWLIDNNKIHREKFGTTRVPETYVFSSDKKMLRKYTGPQEWNKSMFFQTFDEFIQISTTKL